MGSYMALHFSFEDEANLINVVGSLFSNSFFEPVAICGFDIYKTKRAKGRGRWFLSGYALEDFVARWLSSNRPQPVGLVSLSTGNRLEVKADLEQRQRSRLEDYLLSTANRLPRGAIACND